MSSDTSDLTAKPLSFFKGLVVYRNTLAFFSLQYIVSRNGTSPSFRRSTVESSLQ